MPDAATVVYANELTPVEDYQVAAWQVLLPTGDRLPTLIGNCPACNHRCQVPVTDEIIQGGVLAAADAASPSGLTRLIECNCPQDHRQPTGVRTGCGRYWLARLEKAEDGSYRLSAERNITLMPAATALSDALATQDKRVQSAAEKWIGAVTAIYGLFSIAGIAVGRTALSGLSYRYKWLVAAVVLAGLVAAGSAIMFGYLAAYGWPRVVEVDTNEKLQAWYRSYRRYAFTAAKRLRKAVYLALVSLAALSAVMVLMWFLPRK
ncbi:MAG: hypothetical protein ACLP8X_08075 [Streptosporangiaceae bacterium]